MTKEELKTTADLFPVLDKNLVIKNLSKEELYTLCECLNEDVYKWMGYAKSARNQLSLLLNTKKTSKEFQNIFKDLI